MEEITIRYENVKVDFIDHEFLCFTNDEHEGNIVLVSTDELVAITNEIRKNHGYTDLVGTKYENEVYYNFYLMFNTKEKSLSIQAVCNYGEKDDEVYYELPMTKEEKENVKWKLIDILASELYKN